MCRIKSAIRRIKFSCEPKQVEIINCYSNSVISSTRLNFMIHREALESKTLPTMKSVLQTHNNG